jgi:hypothetical protein
MAAMTGWAVLVLVIWWCAPRCTIASAEGWQQSRRAVRSRVKVWAGPTNGRRAISGPLTPVTSGLLRSLADTLRRRPDLLEARTAQIPKLIMRLRFPSPAPSGKPQVGVGIIPLALAHHELPEPHALIRARADAKLSQQDDGYDPTPGSRALGAFRLAPRAALCRIWPYLVQERRLRRRWPGVSGPLCLVGPRAARRATPKSTDQSSSFGAQRDTRY